jgi:hypothetical protein
MAPGRAVVAVNYHRIGCADLANPLDRLHTIREAVFRAQLDSMQDNGTVVSPDDVRAYHGLTGTSFVVTFDDAPAAAMTGIQMLLDRQLPVTISVCTQLASAGWGTRDKVYCIDRLADPARVDAATRAAFPDATAPGEPISFYHFTKREDLDPGRVTATLIDPLFAEIEPQARPYLGTARYLGWTAIRDLARHPLVTIANHTASHPNLAALPPGRLAAEIVQAHRVMCEQLGQAPEYLAIPFGRISQRLAADCIDIVHPLGYRGILWVGNAGTLVTGPYDAQLLQLTRLHAPDTSEEFCARTTQLARSAATTAVWQLAASGHRDPVTITESSDAVRAARHEMLVRQGKDYASSPSFYRYQFTANPAKGSRPDYYAVERDGRMEATAYNFHATFRVGPATVPGVYLASWRKLPDAHQAAAGRLVHRMTSREPVTGAYHPSTIAASAFAHWRQIPVWTLTLPVSSDRAGLDGLHHAVHLDTYDDLLSPLAEALMRNADFTLARDSDFYRWRHDTYPLATCRYVVLCRRAEPVAYAVTMATADRAQIADWYAPSPADYTRLAVAVHDSARERGARLITVETSSHAAAAAVAARFGAPVTCAANYYQLNRARLTEHGITEAEVARLLAQWPALRFHETASTGDTLLR